MAKLKRLAAPKWWPIERKTKKFTVVSRGPHPKDLSLPLLILIRDVFKLAETGKESKSIIKKGEILVDNRKVKDPKFGVGIFDVIEIPALKKAWRAIPKNGLTFIEIPKKDKKLKICKIIDKKTLKGNKTQLNMNDGRNILTNKKYSTQDSLLIELPEQKIIEHIKFEEGSIAMVLRGKNAGIIAKIKEIEKNRVWLGEEKTFEVPKRLLIVVGKDKIMIKLE
ncbi:MAG: 30S ribosomal protein S4e [Candidatus Aenigmarchaeota archaeon]|nr:30S ribosomal protein S4e [Candidatus Aenigmarchaeota archaeon]